MAAVGKVGTRGRYWGIRITWYLGGVAATSLAVGCATYGSVRVGTPQVFTREHLVGQRVREHQWVDQQLKDAASVSPTFTGLRDVSVFSGIANNLKLSLTPKPGGDTGTGDAADAAVKGASSDASTDAGTSDAANKSPEDTKTPAADAGNDSEKKDADASPAPGLVVPGTLKRGSDAKKTVAEFDAMQTFEYRMAVRDRINAALRETELDDTHDLQGATLYTLQFPLTVVPGASSSQFAGVELYVDEPGEAALECNDPHSNTPIRQRDYEAWLRGLQRQIQDEQFAEQEALRGHTSLRRRAKIYSCDGIPRDPALESRCQGNDKEQLRCRAAACVARKYQSRLAFEFSDPNSRESRVLQLAHIDPPIAYGGGDYASTVHGDPGTRGDFWTRLWLLGWCWRHHDQAYAPISKDPEPMIRVVGIEPKEYSQNVSEVAASETLIRLTASIHALIPNSGGDVQNDTDYARKSQALLQSITNAPLVVGYSDSAAMFGWLLGPSFTIKGTKASFLQRPATRIVTVDLSVPAWWPSLKLSGALFWLDGSGRSSHRQALWDGKPLEVALPGDVRALSTTLMSARLSERPQPSIQFVEPNFPRPGDRVGEEKQCVFLRATDPAKPTPEQVVYIRGRELWRSPQVFLGAQQADDVECMSDMGGLVAHFKRIDMPGTGKERSAAVNLSVVTSVGEATLYKKAIIEGSWVAR